MDVDQNSLHYNESLILSELERRFYLYLIGGEYEKLFYVYDSAESSDIDVEEKLSVTRVRLEMEVSQSERDAQARDSWADPEYKGTLDYMLKSRVNNKLENQSDLFLTCPELLDLKPILADFNDVNELDESLCSTIKSIGWLTKRIIDFAGNPLYAELIGFSDNDQIDTILDKIGYSLFIWLLPRFVSEQLHERMHPSLAPMVERLRQYGRLTSGAIATLIKERHCTNKHKWKTYMLAGVNVVPLFLVINLVNNEILTLVEQQHSALQKSDGQYNKKLRVLNDYACASEAIRDLLSLEEILKPHILEHIGFKHFDPLPYLLGYADETSPLANIFFQARAYAFYRQLFKTGRIQPHETAIFLKKHNIDKVLLHKLNEFDLTSIASHIKLHDSIDKAQSGLVTTPQ